MRSTIKYLTFVLVILLVLIIQEACVHDLTGSIPPDPDPKDTTEVVSDTMDTDTMTGDTTTMDTTTNSMPCDSNKIYFDIDILPILNNNCALSGCHDAMSASDGVILISYESVIASDIVEAFNLSESDLYEVLTEDDEDDIMPPTGRLDNELITKIAQWILEGAQDLQCDDTPIDCDIEGITYSGFVSNLMAQNCNGCHSTNGATGGIITDNHASLKSIADSGQLYGAISWAEGFKNMPQNLDQLDECSILKVKTWIDEGAQNN